MGPFSGPVVLFTVFICAGSCFAYMEALAAHADKFRPEVAFICNKPAMHRVVNGWEPDFSTDCLEDPEDILEYCKKVYPDHDVKNVVETSYKVEIPDWPKFDGPEPARTGDHKVTPFSCLVGDFESEALLVPQHCIFDHEHDEEKCERPSVWSKVAADECAGQDKVLEGSGMLVLCGTDKFRGVEYVCCPKEDSSEEEDDSEETVSDSVESTDSQDAYMAYLNGDDMDRYGNEHSKFRAAEKSMKRLQHEKVTKMMKEWQEARDHVADMRKTDQQAADQVNNDITERFKRLYTAFEEEGNAEKKQLTALHQQRVQAMFNKKKNLLMTSYKEELSSDTPAASKILSYLKLYIRTEEKDRLHTVNMYEHRRDTDPAEAMRIRDSQIQHLKLIDDRISDAIDMLKRVPDLEKKIRPEIDEFRHKKFRSLDISIDDVILTPTVAPKQPAPVEIIPLDNTPLESDDSNEGHDYTNIQIDSEGLTMQEANREPVVANAQHSGAHVQQTLFAGESSHGSSVVGMVGIGIGSVAVFIIIAVAVVMVKKRRGNQPILHGFVEVDPAASPEERHVANMQMNGYENPTYRYFEVGQN